MFLYALPLFTFLLAEPQIVYGMDDEMPGRNHQGRQVPLAPNLDDEDYLSSLSIDELKGLLEKQSLVCQLIQARRGLKTSGINLADKEDEAANNRQKRALELTKQKQELQLDTEFKRQERLTALIKARAEIGIMFDKHKGEMQKLALENMKSQTNFEYQRRRTERSVFGAIKDTFAGITVETPTTLPQGPFAAIEQSRESVLDELKALQQPLQSQGRVVVEEPELFFAYCLRLRLLCQLN